MVGKKAIGRKRKKVESSTFSLFVACGNNDQGNRQLVKATIVRITKHRRMSGITKTDRRSVVYREKRTGHLLKPNT